jgi:hypothetical protein
VAARLALAADTYAPNGNYGDFIYKKNMKSLKYHLSYQPAWDQNGRMLQKLAGYVPMAVMPGSEYMHCGNVIRHV